MTDPTPTANVQAILDAYAETDGTYVGANGIVIRSLELHTEGPNGNAIMLTTPDNTVDDPIVIVNPPIIIPDALGDIDKDGMKFREDPLCAISLVIQQYGGPAQ